jgi:putative molybdopterin biosynthesis protein
MTGTNAGAGSGSGGAESAGDNGMRLRLARLARGLSQQQLAGMAEVSRQAVSAIESGLSDPSLRVALALARALGVTVEEMFGPRGEPPEVAARPVAPLGGGGGRVALAPMGEGFVALPLAGPTASRAGFLPAGGQATGMPAGGGQAERVQAEGVQAGGGQAERVQADGVQADSGQADGGQADGGQAEGGQAEGGQAGRARAVQVRPIGPPRPTLVMAGCDPAMPLLETPLSLLDPPVALSWWPCPSLAALELAAAGLVHVAGAHLRGSEGEYNTGPAADTLRQGAEIIGFCSWREGLVVRPGLAISGVGDVARLGLRVVNREAGAEARSVLDRELARLGIAGSTLPGYDTQATGHLQVAAAIAAGLADVGVASEPAALAYGLGFIPLAAERFDLVIPAGQAGAREVQSLLKVLSSRWLLDQLASLPGYNATSCGEHVATVPPAPGGAVRRGGPATSGSGTAPTARHQGTGR